MEESVSSFMSDVLLPALLLGAGVVFLLLTERIVPQQRAYLVERLGKFNRTMEAGLHFTIPFIQLESVKGTTRNRERRRHLGKKG
jgi:regulator of protease activity HflC (stomatin/prohibitin superfamily)